MSSKAAPLYTDSFMLCEWVLQHFDNDSGELARNLCEAALALLRSIVLALKLPQREDEIEAADEHLLVLRTYLRLAQARGHLDEDQLLHALERADGIGRQIGGWLRSLERT